MRRFTAVILCLLLLLSLAACGLYNSQDLSDAKRAAYDEGYDDGLAAGEFHWSDYGRSEGYEDGYRDGHLEGYDEGYADGSRSADDLEDAATSYASKNGGWHPEEAMCIIEDFENGTANYFDTVPTVEEYIEAVHTLYYFYEYFYSR